MKMTIKQKKLSGLLKCIRCKSDTLYFPEGSDTLICSACGHTYPVKEEVPVLLPDTDGVMDTQPGLHEKAGSEFRYIDHYDKDAYASDYFEVRDSGTEHIERRTRECISAEVNGRSGAILDVGCGKAWVAQMFCGKGFDVVSMDLALRNTTKALQLYPYPNHYAVVADAFHLPFRKNLFDYIIASEIIEHVYDPEKFIGELMTALKPGGKLIVTTPYKEKIQYSLCVHCNKPTPVHAHLHSFDEQKLKGLYTKEDLKRWEHKTFGNKVLMHLRTHPVLKYLNYRMWRFTDDFANFVYDTPSRILVMWEKKEGGDGSVGAET